MCLRVLIVFTAAINCIVLLASWPPLGIPDEWVWPRHALPQDVFEAIDRIIWPLICGGFLVVFAMASLRRIDSVGPFRRRLLVFILAAMNFLWLNAVRQAAPSPHRELRPTWILYDKYASGYFYQATFQTESTSEMLAGYEERMSQGDVLHEGTHPPGLLLLNRAMLRLTETVPTIVAFLETIQNDDAVKMFREVEKSAGLNRPLTKSEFAALQLSSLLSTIVAAVTVVPVFGVAQRLSNTIAAWRGACLAITVPTIGIFVPRSDVLYACSGMLLTYTAISAVVSEHQRTRWTMAVMSGVILFCCLVVSLAHLPIILMLTLFILAFIFADLKNRTMPALKTAIAAIAVFLAACLFWQFATRCNLFMVWKLNLTNHSAFYSQSPRSWSAWIAVNPIEVAMAAGLPMASIAAVVFARNLKPLWTVPSTRWTNERIFVITCFATWTLLWLSGKNNGEAARLWCFVTPWIAVIAGLLPDLESNARGRFWPMLLIAQLIVATVTVGRVSGFLEF